MMSETAPTILRPLVSDSRPPRASPIAPGAAVRIVNALIASGEKPLSCLKNWFLNWDAGMKNILSKNAATESSARALRFLEDLISPFVNDGCVDRNSNLFDSFKYLENGFMSNKARIEIAYRTRQEPGEIPAIGNIRAARPAPKADPITRDASDHARAVAGTFSDETMAINRTADVANALVITWSTARKYIFGARAPIAENIAPMAVEKMIILVRPILSAKNIKIRAGHISNLEAPSTRP